MFNIDKVMSRKQVLAYVISVCLSYRSEGEKVRVGDDLILVSVATERYLVSGAAILFVCLRNLLVLVN